VRTLDRQAGVVLEPGDDLGAGAGAGADAGTLVSEPWVLSDRQVCFGSSASKPMLENSVRPALAKYQYSLI
jgi:hypothetical protein